MSWLSDRLRYPVLCLSLLHVFRFLFFFLDLVFLGKGFFFLFFLSFSHQAWRVGRVNHCMIP